MKPELYEQFISLKEMGRRAEAKVVLDEFIASFQSFGEKAVWVRAFLERQEFEDKIRHEIYEQLVFPVLLEGYSRKDVWSVFNLAKTSQNLYAAKSLHAVVEFRSEFQFLIEAYELEPTEQVRKYLLDRQIRGFHYSQHEWPAGILYGSNGASLDECDEILQEVTAARILDRENVRSLFLTEFEAKVKEYKSRLSQRQSIG